MKLDFYIKSGCRLAESDHRMSKRQYAHVGHCPGAICVCKAFWKLPAAIKLGILLHELGHMLDLDEEDERAVDRLASKAFGVTIKRRDTKYGKQLECVSQKAVAEFRDLLTEVDRGVRN